MLPPSMIHLPFTRDSMSLLSCCFRPSVGGGRNLRLASPSWIMVTYYAAVAAHVVQHRSQSSSALTAISIARIRRTRSRSLTFGYCNQMQQQQQHRFMSCKSVSEKLEQQDVAETQDSKQDDDDNDDKLRWLEEASAIPPPAYDPSRSYFPIYYNDVYEVNLPPQHRFPMAKYAQVRTLVQTGILPSQTEDVDNVVCDFRVSPLATIDELTTTHSPDYVSRYMRGDQTERELRNVGFPWSMDGVRRSLSSTGGTVAAAKAVCEAVRVRRQQSNVGDESQTSPKSLIWAAHVAGGTHHAFYDRGEGFCVFSDIAVAANVVRRLYPDVLSSRMLILDLDVHQGNGNAVLFQGRPDVITFSLHCEANYFSPKEQSDLDIELPAGCTDETYLGTLQHWLRQIKRHHDTHAFDLVFFQAGVDVLEEDRLGRMSLTQQGVRRRNQMVFDFCRDLDLPLVITMGGGYPRNEESWQPVLEAHANVYIQAWHYLRQFG